jgi:pimeloyl-ACP methyl ester carboxylesterase
MLNARIVAIGDAQLNVYDAGSGQSILFLHGNASRWKHWEPQLHALAPHFRCIAFDFRGYGASSPLTRSNSLSLMADDAAALCQALRVEHAYIVGLSMGTGVAQALALRHPSLVDGLVLAGPLQIDIVPGAVPKLTIDLLRPLLIASFSPAF